MSFDFEVKRTTPNPERPEWPLSRVLLLFRPPYDSGDDTVPPIEQDTYTVPLPEDDKGRREELARILAVAGIL